MQNLTGQFRLRDNAAMRATQVSGKIIEVVKNQSPPCLLHHSFPLFKQRACGHMDVIKYL